jgi:hypothetical protein
MVGEKGPELFVPRSSGEIVPRSSLKNSKAFGAKNEVTYNIVVQSLDPKTAGPLVVKALQDHTRINGYVAGVRTAG